MYTVKFDTDAKLKVVADSMILTTDSETNAGSKMLKGYKSLLESEALLKLKAAGYGLCGKTPVGEFAIDLLGETSVDGAYTKDGALMLASADAVKTGDADIALVLDVNGSVRRGTAQSGLISVKPTYGTVSRYGTVPVACSGETVSLIGKTAEDCKNALSVISGHDDKDGTSLSDELCKSALSCGSVKRIAVLKSMTEGADSCVKAKIDAFVNALKENGIEACEIDDTVIVKSRAAWNILMSAELCNNVSRYDGVKYGYRTENFTNLDELYTNSRTEAFGQLLKTAILFGSDTLSTENYMKVYDKALRVRRVVLEAFNKIFGEFDAVLMPACSKMVYTEKDTENKFLSYTENLYTAPASITGLPAVVACGVQLVGKAFSEGALLDTVNAVCKEGK
ncbi:MAG: hypothetical protein IKC74_06160 [Clostridia bacterium]|nr:hypothetical protein [Clostridia bacterium]